MESRTFVPNETRNSALPHETQLQYSGHVIVGPDGNGATADSFATTASGNEVRYLLIVIAAEDAPATQTVTITLNDEVVLQTQVEFDREHVEVALNPAGGELNRIVITAGGVLNSASRVAVLATRPADVFFGGLSVLPWARANERVHTFLAVHNAGVAQVAFRIAFFDRDGSVAGRSAPQRLGRHATHNASLNEVATALGLRWTHGAIHVEWVARGSSRVSTVASEERREPNSEDSLTVIGIRTLPLADYRPRPITVAAAEAFGF
jgi:hypothetical protein